MPDPTRAKRPDLAVLTPRAERSGEPAGETVESPCSGASLSVRSVSHWFGDVQVLDQVDFDVDAGEVHCLLGPSGSGKSTFLRLVAGLETLRAGRIEISEKCMADSEHSLPPEQRPVGFVFQDYALFPHLDVISNVGFGITDRAGRTEQARALLDDVGMAEFARSMPHTLSGGQQQRVALARALARRPHVMLLDEPFSGLDAKLRDEVRRGTLEVLRRRDVATVVVTHDPREALLVADRISVLRAGRLVQTGTPDEVYSRWVDPEVAEVFGPVNRFVGLVDSRGLFTPWGLVDVGGLPAGSQVEAMVRAESIVLRELPSDDAAPRSGASDSEGVVVAMQRTGGSVDLVVQMEGGANVHASDLARRGWTVGDRVSVSAISTDVVFRSLQSDY